MKGDTACSIFYMAVRYEGNNAKIPDLYLVDDISSTSGKPKVGKRCTLLQLYNADPVDSWFSATKKLWRGKATVTLS